jgi:hypothetical protein
MTAASKDIRMDVGWALMKEKMMEKMKVELKGNNKVELMELKLANE